MPAKPLLICMCGLPRSGKSTVAKQLSKDLDNAPIVKKDDIRLALHGNVYIASAEPFVRAISKVMVHSLFLSGHEVVIADETHISRQARDFMRNDDVWDTEFYPVYTPPNECLQRAAATNQPWLYDVIEEMVSRWEPLGEDEVIYPTDDDLFKFDKITKEQLMVLWKTADHFTQGRDLGDETNQPT